MWDRCWSTAVVRLGLTSDEFFRLTPRQLRVLADKDWERMESQQEHAELLIGILAAATVNHSFCRPKEPKAPADFMPSQKTKSKVKEHQRQSVADSIRKFFNLKLAKQNSEQESKSEAVQP